MSDEGTSIRRTHGQLHGLNEVAHAFGKLGPMHLELARRVTTHGDLHVVTADGQAHVRAERRLSRQFSTFLSDVAITG